MFLIWLACLPLNGGGATDAHNLGRWLEKLAVRVIKTSPRQRRLVATGAIVITLLLAVMVSVGKPTWAVQIDGQTIGYTKDNKGVLSLAQTILDSEDNISAEPPCLELVRVKGKHGKPVPVSKLHETLANKLLCLTDAWVVQVDGEDLSILATETEANEVLEGVLKAFPGEAGSDVKENYIKEKAEITCKTVHVCDVTGVDEAIDFLIRGTNEERKYEVVAGDNLWTIARDHDMYVDDILAANPGISELLQIGQTISLVVPKPYVTVVSKEQKTVIEAIAFQTETIADNSLYTYERKVRSAGKQGSKLTTYALVRENGVIVEQVVVDEQIEAEPTTEVVLVGTKQPDIALWATRR